jgi:hypothetical protein
MPTFTNVFGGDNVPPSEYAYAAYSISANAELVWPFNFNGTNLLEADILEITATVAALTLMLPPASNVSVGTDFLIRNMGAEDFEIIDQDSNSLTTIAPGEAKLFYVSDNSSVAGTWGIFTYGTGTSSADASALAGYGLRVWLAKLVPDHSYIEKNADYTVVDSDRNKLINVITGSITINMPLSSDVEAGFHVLIRNSSVGSITVDGNGIEEIDGELTFTLMPGESAIFVCSGSDWYTVGYGRDVDFTFSEFVINAAGGDVTLSASDVSGRMIRVAGVAAADIEVTLPAIDNVYFVNTESGLGVFSVTFTTGSGLTTVLPASQRTALYSDGTNVITAITTSLTTTISLADGSAGAPSLSFALDPDTGIYRLSPGQVGFTSNGSLIISFTGDGLRLGGGDAMTPPLLINSLGGLFARFGVTDDLGVSVMGIEVGYFTNTGWNGNVIAPAGASPTITFAGDSNSGISGTGADSISIETGGSKRLTVANAQITANVLLALAANLNIAGNIVFSGNSRLITADFSNATGSLRTLFQSSTVNGTTALGVIPNGTATTGSIQLGNASDPDNQSRLICRAAVASVDLVSAQVGTGVLMPMTFIMGALTETMRLATGGNLEIARFTKIGELAPAIKTKKLTGTTNAAAGGVANAAHGLTLAKIIGLQALVGTNPKLTHGSGTAANLYSVTADATNVIITNGAASGANVNNQPFSVFVTYEE